MGQGEVEGKKASCLLTLSLREFQELTEAYLDHGDYNVLAVDWGGGSAALYSQAAANTRLVALEVAAVIEAIMVWWIEK